VGQITYFHCLWHRHDVETCLDEACPIEEGDAMQPLRGIALVAHDSCKQDMVDWATFNRKTLSAHRLFATGTTGGLLVDQVKLSVTRLRSGPHGGDQQIGSRIAEGDVDLLIFFWDPLTAQPHEPDVRALLRLAVLSNIPVACNRATADFVISSPLLAGRDPWTPALVPA
jgi:methylglyoxal synthase